MSHESIETIERTGGSMSVVAGSHKSPSDINIVPLQKETEDTRDCWQNWTFRKENCKPTNGDPNSLGFRGKKVVRIIKFSLKNNPFSCLLFHLF